MTVTVTMTMTRTEAVFVKGALIQARKCAEELFGAEYSDLSMTVLTTYEEALAVVDNALDRSK